MPAPERDAQSYPQSYPLQYGDRNTVASGDFDPDSCANSITLAVTACGTKFVSNRFSISFSNCNSFSYC